MLVVLVTGDVEDFNGGALNTFGMTGVDGLDVGFMVLHMGGCDVINQGGLGRLVVVVVVARKKTGLSICCQ